MYQKLRRWELASFLLTGITGPLLHFLYEWSEKNPIVAAFSAVNESIWEHMKILFFPVFLLTLIEMAVFSDRHRNLPAAKAIATVLGILLIPVLYYTYSGIWGQRSSIVDIAIYYIAAAFIYRLGYRLIEKGRPAGSAAQLFGLLLLWAIAFLFVWFTYAPPRIALFRDPITGQFGL